MSKRVRLVEASRGAAICEREEGVGMSQDTWERGYDVGYYEALRNATATLITLSLNGTPVQDVIKHLAELRENAFEIMKGKEDEI
jgi:hypothetical protein